MEIRGGELGDQFLAFDGSDLTIAGGSFGEDFRAYDGSNIVFRGTEFLLNGVPIEGLVAGAPTLVTARDVTLSGTLADGSPSSFELGSTGYERSPFGAWGSYDFFATGAMVSVTLVPEPAPALLVAAAVLLAMSAVRYPR